MHWSNCSLALTHWGRVTHICVSKLTIIGSDNGLSPCRRQAIIWTNAGILLIRTSGTNFSEILCAIHSFSFSKMRLKISSATWRLFGLGLNELSPWCTPLIMHWSYCSLVLSPWCTPLIMHWSYCSLVLSPWCTPLIMHWSNCSLVLSPWCTPLIMHWSYCSLVLSPWCTPLIMHWSNCSLVLSPWCTPLIMHWSYCSLVLSPWCTPLIMHWSYCSLVLSPWCTPLIMHWSYCSLVLSPWCTPLIMHWSYCSLVLSHRCTHRLEITVVDGSVQDCSNSTANALELLQSCTKPSMYSTGLRSQWMLIA